MKGFSVAQYSIGVKYFLGEPIKMDEEEGLRWIQLSADQGYVDGIFLIGLCYFYGNVYKRDRIESLKWFKRAKTRDYLDSNYLLGSNYLQNSQNNPLNLKLGYQYVYQSFLDLNTCYEEVIYTLGICNEYKLGIEIGNENEDIFEFYLNSSQNEYPPKMYALGRCYEEGIGTEVDLNEARRLYEVAAEGGDIDAQIRLIEYVEDKKPIKLTYRGKYETLI